MGLYRCFLMKYDLTIGTRKIQVLDLHQVKGHQAYHANFVFLDCSPRFDIIKEIELTSSVFLFQVQCSICSVC